MEKILEQSLLYDFYGELLTDHQKQVYEDVVFGDYSLSEAAEVHQISRQGVHDLIKRCDRTLHEYESKLGLVQKFQDTRQLVAEIHDLTQEYERTGNPECVKKIEIISRKIGEL
ncbi:MAG: YlxM family DNA-binding protein [Clostridiales bacterium]|nr:YlxM family DNA-binding protein [Clostridiales bacterium]